MRYHARYRLVMKPKYALARRMRRQLTLPEYLLWERLKVRGEDNPIFRRQYALGPYILDFYCVRARLAVEVDGCHHSLEAQAGKDVLRDSWLMERGIEAYRIQAADVFADADRAADGAILKAAWRLRQP